MTNVAEQLDRALKAAGLLIDGVSTGDPSDRSTWQVQWAGTPTKEASATANALIATLVVQDDPLPLTAEDLLVYVAKKLGVTVEDARADIAAAQLAASVKVTP